MRHKKLIDMCESTGQNVTNKTKYIYILYIYEKNAVVNTQTSEAKTPHRKNSKNHKTQTASTVDTKRIHLFSYSSGGSPAAAFATAPTHLILVKRLSSQSQCCFQTLLQLPL